MAFVWIGRASEYDAIAKKCELQESFLLAEIAGLELMRDAALNVIDKNEAMLFSLSGDDLTRARKRIDSARNALVRVEATIRSAERFVDEARATAAAYRRAARVPLTGKPRLESIAGFDPSHSVFDGTPPP